MGLARIRLDIFGTIEEVFKCYDGRDRGEKRRAKASDMGWSYMQRRSHDHLGHGLNNII